MSDPVSAVIPQMVQQAAKAAGTNNQASGYPLFPGCFAGWRHPAENCARARHGR